MVGGASRLRRGAEVAPGPTRARRASSRRSRPARARRATWRRASTGIASRRVGVRGIAGAPACASAPAVGRASLARRALGEIARARARGAPPWTAGRAHAGPSPSPGRRPHRHRRGRSSNGLARQAPGGARQRRYCLRPLLMAMPTAPRGGTATINRNGARRHLAARSVRARATTRPARAYPRRALAPSRRSSAGRRGRSRARRSPPSASRRHAIRRVGVFAGPRERARARGRRRAVDRRARPRARSPSPQASGRRRASRAPTCGRLGERARAGRRRGRDGGRLDPALQTRRGRRIGAREPACERGDATLPCASVASSRCRGRATPRAAWSRGRPSAATLRRRAVRSRRGPSSAARRATRRGYGHGALGGHSGGLVASRPVRARTPPRERSPAPPSAGRRRRRGYARRALADEIAATATARRIAAGDRAANLPSPAGRPRSRMHSTGIHGPPTVGPLHRPAPHADAVESPSPAGAPAARIATEVVAAATLGRGQRRVGSRVCVAGAPSARSRARGIAANHSWLRRVVAVVFFGERQLPGAVAVPGVDRVRRRRIPVLGCWRSYRAQPHLVHVLHRGAATASAVCGGTASNSPTRVPAGDACEAQRHRAGGRVSGRASHRQTRPPRRAPRRVAKLPRRTRRQAARSPRGGMSAAVLAEHLRGDMSRVAGPNVEAKVKDRAFGADRVAAR